jgi:hypothetical protein
MGDISKGVANTLQPAKKIYKNNNNNKEKMSNTVLMRFLGIILRVLRLEVFCMDFLNHREGGMVFYQVFLLSPFQYSN